MTWDVQLISCVQILNINLKDASETNLCPSGQNIRKVREGDPVCAQYFSLESKQDVCCGPRAEVWNRRKTLSSAYVDFPCQVIIQTSCVWEKVSQEMYERKFSSRTDFPENCASPLSETAPIQQHGVICTWRWKPAAYLQGYGASCISQGWTVVFAEIPDMQLRKVRLVSDQWELLLLSQLAMI